MMYPRYGFLCLVLLASIAAAHASGDADVLDRANKAVRTGDLDRAEMILNGYFESGGRNREARFLYARVLAWQADYDQAIEQWRMVLDLEPDHPQRTELLNLIKKRGS